MKTRLIILLLFISGYCAAQVTTVDYRRNLSKGVSLNVKQEKVGNVLQMIGKAGGFYFSYNGVLFRQDSLINLNVKNVPCVRF